ncbi:MAG: fatty-acyl-CoA synthase [Gammaproteobacteria bacterium]|jgi:fatty-acyl-CoA synthase
MKLRPTPTVHSLPQQYRFRTLSEALDHASRGATGCNFYTGRGELFAVLPYAELREQALQIGSQLLGLGLSRGARIALVAETHPSFHRFFFGCQYAGLVPVAVPPPLQLGGRHSYVALLRRLLSACDAQVCIGSADIEDLMLTATRGLNLVFVGTPESFACLPDGRQKLRPSVPRELAYIQYTSGSTQFPRGVMITQHAVMSNVAGTIEHLRIRDGDRAVSWLPYYHDMGLVGFVLAPLASQISVDYLGSREFAMRPRQWLVRMSESQATISFSPPFGYELCARRLRCDDVRSLDLSAWRVAGIGAEPIRLEPLLRFAALAADGGFDPAAFLPCYGLAEASLAVTFGALNQGLRTQWFDEQSSHEAPPLIAIGSPHQSVGKIEPREVVNCGRPLPGHHLEIRDEVGRKLPDEHCGSIYIHGPSLMRGYIESDVTESSLLSQDSWLDTGDLGYVQRGDVFVTGRKKDLMIINGRNIWPQDLERLAEQFDEVRTGDASAFSIPLDDGREQPVLVVQFRQTDYLMRGDFVKRLRQSLNRELGIDCVIELVRPRTLPRTSSGKLSRSQARKDYLRRTEQQNLSMLGNTA